MADEKLPDIIPLGKAPQLADEFETIFDEDSGATVTRRRASRSGGTAGNETKIVGKLDAIGQGLARDWHGETKADLASEFAKTFFTKQEFDKLPPLTAEEQIELDGFKATPAPVRYPSGPYMRPFTQEPLSFQRQVELERRKNAPALSAQLEKDLLRIASELELVNQVLAENQGVTEGAAKFNNAKDWWEKTKIGFSNPLDVAATKGPESAWTGAKISGIAAGSALAAGLSGGTTAMAQAAALATAGAMTANEGYDQTLLEELVKMDPLIAKDPKGFLAAYKANPKDYKQAYEDAKTKALISGVAEGGAETLSAGLFKFVPGGKTLLGKAANELGGELTEEFSSLFAGKAARGEGLPTGAELVDTVFSTAAGTGMQSGVMAAGGKILEKTGVSKAVADAFKPQIQVDQSTLTPMARSPFSLMPPTAAPQMAVDLNTLTPIGAPAPQAQAQAPVTPQLRVNTGSLTPVDQASQAGSLPDIIPLSGPTQQTAQPAQAAAQASTLPDVIPLPGPTAQATQAPAPQTAQAPAQAAQQPAQGPSSLFTPPAPQATQTQAGANPVVQQGTNVAPSAQQTQATQPQGQQQAQTNPFAPQAQGQTQQSGQAQQQGTNVLPSAGGGNGLNTQTQGSQIPFTQQGQQTGQTGQTQPQQAGGVASAFNPQGQQTQGRRQIPFAPVRGVTPLNENERTQVADMKFAAEQMLLDSGTAGSSTPDVEGVAASKRDDAGEEKLSGGFESGAALYITARQFEGATREQAYAELVEKFKGKTATRNLIVNGKQAIFQVADTLDGLPVSKAFEKGSKLASTRFPTGVSASEDSTAYNLQSNIASVYSNPDKMRDFANHFKTIAGFKFDPKMSDREIVDAFMKHVERNLLHMFDQVPPEIRDRSKLWYIGANLIAKRLSEQHGISHEAAAGVLAVLSPQMDWYKNVSLAERALDVILNKSGHAVDQKMIDVMKGRNAIAKIALEMQENAAGIPKNKQTDYPSDKDKSRRAELIRKKARLAVDSLGLTGQKIGEIKNKRLQAVALRAYDEAYNPRAYDVITPEGGKDGPFTSLDGEDSDVGWSSFGPIEKCFSIVADQSMGNINVQLGEEHKVRNFYNNIIDPDARDGQVTIDTHAVAGALLEPLSGEDVEVTKNLGGAGGSSLTGLSGVYPVYAHAYAMAARARGVLPREMQSITWEAVRGLFTATYKSEKTNVAKIKSIWNSYKNGESDFATTIARIESAVVEGKIESIRALLKKKEIDATEADRRIALVRQYGAYGRPTWYRPDGQGSEGAGSGTDQGQLGGTQLGRDGGEPDQGTTGRGSERPPARSERDEASWNELERKAAELDRRRAARAQAQEKNTDPATRRRGNEQIALKFINELRRGGRLTFEEATAALRIVENLMAKGYLDNMAISVSDEAKGGKVRGEYEAAQELVKLFVRNTNRPGVLRYTFAHEVAHHLERMIPAKDLEAARQQFLRDRAKWLKDKAGLRELLGDGNWLAARLSEGDVKKFLANNTLNPALLSKYFIRDMSDPKKIMWRIKNTDETYRLTNFSEYFADKIADIATARDDARVNSQNLLPVFAKLKELLAQIKKSLMDVFGKDKVEAIWDNFQEGTYTSDFKRDELAGYTKTGGQNPIQDNVTTADYRKPRFGPADADRQTRVDNIDTLEPDRPIPPPQSSRDNYHAGEAAKKRARLKQAMVELERLEQVRDTAEGRDGGSGESNIIALQRSRDDVKSMYKRIEALKKGIEDDEYFAGQNAESTRDDGENSPIPGGYRDAFIAKAKGLAKPKPIKFWTDIGHDALGDPNKQFLWAIDRQGKMQVISVKDLTEKVESPQQKARRAQIGQDAEADEVTHQDWDDKEFGITRGPAHGRIDATGDVVRISMVRKSVGLEDKNATREDVKAQLAKFMKLDADSMRGYDYTEAGAFAGPEVFSARDEEGPQKLSIEQAFPASDEDAGFVPFSNRAKALLGKGYGLEVRNPDKVRPVISVTSPSGEGLAEVQIAIKTGKDGKPSVSKKSPEFPNRGLTAELTAFGTALIDPRWSRMLRKNEAGLTLESLMAEKKRLLDLAKEHVASLKEVIVASPEEVARRPYKHGGPLYKTQSDFDFYREATLRQLEKAQDEWAKTPKTKAEFDQWQKSQLAKRDAVINNQTQHDAALVSMFSETLERLRQMGVTRVNFDTLDHGMRTVDLMAASAQIDNMLMPEAEGDTEGVSGYSPIPDIDNVNVNGNLFTALQVAAKKSSPDAWTGGWGSDNSDASYAIDPNTAYSARDEEGPLVPKPSRPGSFKAFDEMVTGREIPKPEGMPYPYDLDRFTTLAPASQTARKSLQGYHLVQQGSDQGPAGKDERREFRVVSKWPHHPLAGGGRVEYRILFRFAQSGSRGSKGGVFVTLTDDSSGNTPDSVKIGLISELFERARQAGIKDITLDKTSAGQMSPEDIGLWGNVAKNEPDINYTGELNTYGVDKNTAYSARDEEAPRKLKADPVVRGNPRADLNRPESQRRATYPKGEDFTREGRDGSVEAYNILGRNKVSPERMRQIQEFVKDSEVKHALYRGQMSAYETPSAELSEDGLTHLALDPDYAAQYAGSPGKSVPDSGSKTAIVQVYLNAKNILDISDVGHSTMSQRQRDALRKKDPSGLEANEALADRSAQILDKIISEVARINNVPVESLSDLRDAIQSDMDFVEQSDDNHPFVNSVWQYFPHLDTLFRDYGVEAIKYSDSDFRTAKGSTIGGKVSYAVKDTSLIKAAFGDNDVNPDTDNIFQSARDEDGENTVIPGGKREAFFNMKTGVPEPKRIKYYTDIGHPTEGQDKNKFFLWALDDRGKLRVRSVAEVEQMVKETGKDPEGMFDDPDESTHNDWFHNSDETGKDGNLRDSNEMGRIDASGDIIRISYGVRRSDESESDEINMEARDNTKRLLADYLRKDPGEIRGYDFTKTMETGEDPTVFSARDEDTQDLPSTGSGRKAGLVAGALALAPTTLEAATGAAKTGAMIAGVAAGDLIAVATGIAFTASDRLLKGLNPIAANMHLLANDTKSPTMKRIAEMFNRLGGNTSAGAQETYHEERDANRRVYRNKLAKAFEPLAKLSQAQIRALDITIARALAGEIPMPAGPVGEVVQNLQALSDELYRYLREAGIDVNYAKDYAIPHSFNAELVAKDEQAFIDLAEQAYIDNNPKRIQRLLAYIQQIDQEAAQNGGFTQEMTERKDALNVEINKLQGANPRQQAEDLAAAILAGEDGGDQSQGLILASNPRNQNRSDFLKDRVFEQSARAMLREYFQNDPRHAWNNYIARATTLAEFARRFGSKGETWNQLVADMRAEKVKEVDITRIKEHVLDAMGALTPAAQGSHAMANALVGLSNMSKLKSTFLTNFLEAQAQAIPGNLLDAAFAPVVMLREFAAVLAELSPRQRALLKQYLRMDLNTETGNMELARVVGLMDSAGVHNIMENSAYALENKADFREDSRTDRAARGVSQATGAMARAYGIEASENAKRAMGARYASGRLDQHVSEFLRDNILARALKKVGYTGDLFTTRNEAIMRLRRAGINDNNMAAFGAWWEKAKASGNFNELLADTTDPMAALARKAIRMESARAMVNSNRAMKPGGVRNKAISQDNFFGKIVMSFLNYPAAFREQVGKPMARDIATGVRGYESEGGQSTFFSPVERARMIARVAAIPAMAVSAAVFLALRVLALGDDEDKEKLEEKTLLSHMIDGVSYTGFTGGKTEAIQRFRRGQLPPLIDEGTRLAKNLDRESTNANGKERAVTKSVTRSVVVPAGQAVVSTYAPVPIAAAVNQALASKTFNETVVNVVAGPEAKKGSGSGSTRGSGRESGRSGGRSDGR